MIPTFKHANEDVEKMILGNKSDVEDRRVVSHEKGEAVLIITYKESHPIEIYVLYYYSFVDSKRTWN